MNQHESRKVAVQTVYLANQQKLDIASAEAQTVDVLDLKELSAYSKTLVDGVFTKSEELKTAIAAHLSKNWRLERVNQITVAILEVSLYEIKYSNEIEPKAAINEALNLCDEFADPKTKPFVNGILANFVE